MFSFKAVPDDLDTDCTGGCCPSASNHLMGVKLNRKLAANSILDHINIVPRVVETVSLPEMVHSKEKSAVEAPVKPAVDVPEKVSVDVAQKKTVVDVSKKADVSKKIDVEVPVKKPIVVSDSTKPAACTSEDLKHMMNKEQEWGTHEGKDFYTLSVILGQKVWRISYYTFCD